ncbi:hypothetical protein ACFWWN_36115, partial [Streptomyces sp. NPDC059082]
GQCGRQQGRGCRGHTRRGVGGGAGGGCDAARRKERSRFLLHVSGGDGHHALMSWAEIDPDFGGAPVLLATRMDERWLDTPGTQLVVPSDRCGARYVSAVTGIWIGGFRAPVAPEPGLTHAAGRA